MYEFCRNYLHPVIVRVLNRLNPFIGGKTLSSYIEDALTAAYSDGERAGLKRFIWKTRANFPSEKDSPSKSGSIMPVLIYTEDGTLRLENREIKAGRQTWDEDVKYWCHVPFPERLEMETAEDRLNEIDEQRIRNLKWKKDI